MAYPAGMTSRTAVVAGALLLAGCYASHAPWDRAAPDGSAIALRIDVSWGLVGGFLEVRFDGSYVASPPNELRVCEGTMSVEELGAWAALLERTDAFSREGMQGPYVADGGETTVSVASEAGLSARFTFQGGPALHDPALRPYFEWPDRFFASLDLASCEPRELDPATSRVRAWITNFDLAEGHTAWVEIAEDGAVLASVGDAVAESDLEPCEPLDDRRPLLAALMASAPFLPHRPSGWRAVSVWAQTVVTLPDGTTHPREVYFHLDAERPEHAALEAALISIIDDHCAP